MIDINKPMNEIKEALMEIRIASAILRDNQLRRRSGDQPDMVVRSAEGSRWGVMGRRMTRQQREQALDSLLAKLEQSVRALESPKSDS